MVGIVLRTRNPCTTGVLAQTTTQLFVAGFDDTNSLSGEVIGSGPDGTTYILEGIDVLNTTTIPFTMTLVEGSQAMVETVAISADDNFGALAACSFSGTGVGAVAFCAEIVQAGATTTSDVASFPFTSLNIPVSTGTPPAGFSGISIPSGASTQTGSATGKSTITNVSPSNTAPQSTVGPTTTTTASASLRNAKVAVGAPVLIGFVVALLAAF